MPVPMASGVCLPPFFVPRRNTMKTAECHVGQKVRWSYSAIGLEVCGTITKIMDEKVLVDAGSDGVWCVSPDILCLTE